MAMNVSTVERRNWKNRRIEASGLLNDWRPVRTADPTDYSAPKTALDELNAKRAPSLHNDGWMQDGQAALELRTQELPKFKLHPKPGAAGFGHCDRLSCV